MVLRLMVVRVVSYITRPALANERIQCNRAGEVVLQLKSAHQDGTTHLVMSPLEFMQRLAALVPRPRSQQAISPVIITTRTLRARA